MLILGFNAVEFLNHTQDNLHNKNLGRLKRPISKHFRRRQCVDVYEG